MTKYTFEIVKYPAAKTAFCPCGKSVRRQKTFDQTINPFNRKTDGHAKSREDILVELRAEARIWEKEPELCSACSAKEGG